MSDKIASGTPGLASAPLLSTHDIGLVVGLPLLAITAVLAPERAWPRIARLVAPFLPRILSRTQAEIRARVLSYLGEAAHAGAIARALVEAEVLKQLQLMRCRLAGWSPPIALAGEEHLVAALARGRGAVLWDSHFYFASLVTKMALHRGGFRVYHLSQPGHGLSRTRFGMCWLNPIVTAVESRFLAGRVVMSLESPVAALRTLLARLGDNEVVSVTVRGSGVDPRQARFLNGTLRVGTGAADLAYRSGAALLPVFSLRRADGTFVTTLEPPIELPPGAARGAAAQRAVELYCRRLEPYVRASPEQWMEWISV